MIIDCFSVSDIIEQVKEEVSKVVSASAHEQISTTPPPTPATQDDDEEDYSDRVPCVEPIIEKVVAKRRQEAPEVQDGKSLFDYIRRNCSTTITAETCDRFWLVLSKLYKQKQKTSRPIERTRLILIEDRANS